MSVHWWVRMCMHAFKWKSWAHMELVQAHPSNWSTLRDARETSPSLIVPWMPFLFFSLVASCFNINLLLVFSFTVDVFMYPLTNFNKFCCRTKKFDSLFLAQLQPLMIHTLSLSDLSLNFLWQYAYYSYFLANRSFPNQFAGSSD